MCSIVYEPCDENSFKIGPPLYSYGKCGQNRRSIVYGGMSREVYENITFIVFTTDTGVEGSGDDGGSPMVSMDSFRECSDRVMMPCDSEEFITVSVD